MTGDRYTEEDRAAVRQRVPIESLAVHYVSRWRKRGQGIWGCARSIASARRASRWCRRSASITVLAAVRTPVAGSCSEGRHVRVRHPAGVAPARLSGLSESASRVLTLAAVNFNGGLRAYYFALAVLCWLVHPLLFMIVSAWMLLVLVRRQLRSRTFEAIRAFNHSAGEDRG